GVDIRVFEGVLEASQRLHERVILPVLDGRDRTGLRLDPAFEKVPALPATYGCLAVHVDGAQSTGDVQAVVNRTVLTGLEAQGRLAHPTKGEFAPKRHSDVVIPVDIVELQNRIVIEPVLLDGHMDL